MLIVGMANPPYFEACYIKNVNNPNFIGICIKIVIGVGKASYNSAVN